MNPRACDFDDPQFPPLKKKVDKQKQADLAADLLFGSFGDDLFSASNDDGQNVILQNSDASLCDRALDICCHKKDGSLRLTPAPTPPPATASPLFPVRIIEPDREILHLYFLGMLNPI